VLDPAVPVRGPHRRRRGYGPPTGARDSDRFPAFRRRPTQRLLEAVPGVGERFQEHLGDHAAQQQLPPGVRVVVGMERLKVQQPA
jgi:hypothetical protein